MYAWAGKILHIDLNKRRVWTEELGKELRESFLGARGVNAKLLWDLIKMPGIDPLGPENVLIFGVGPLTGTAAPCSGRTTVTCKGPITNLYLKCNMGGFWGAQLKFAGYDHVILHGISKSPVYIWIQDDIVEIKDASHLWGLNVRETDEVIKEELGEKKAEIACIGPAGENLVKFAAIMCSVYNAAARGGVGAVMGSKKLKAIAVRGTGKVTVKEPKRFRELAKEIRENLVKDTTGKSLYQYGTAGGLEFVNEQGSLPAYNFKVGCVADTYPLSGECLVREGYLKRRVGCFGCPLCCHRFVTVDEGPYTGGPEYETVAALGFGTGVINTQAVIKANELCNLMGLDTISTGVVIQWAMESYERGVLTRKDTEGLELTFGNAEAMIKLIPDIARRKSKLGDLLAEGVKKAATKVGKGSWKWAICSSKGLEQAGTDTRASKAYALAFAVNPRGADHLHTETMAECGGTPEAVALIEKITGDKKWANPFSVEYRPEIVRWHEDCYAVTDALGLCVFTSTAAYAVTPKNMAEMFSLATGIKISEGEIMMRGRRIVTLEKCFNVREGADRKLDDLPWRLMHEPSPVGPAKGFVNSKEELDGMLDKYYKLHGWDLKTSWPYKETLEMLGLKDVADQLEKLNRLPKKNE
ncbi:MAG: aldehyde ferredoxin oxidoreductase [Candidatus Iainarchaeum archaeon]|uniref:Aldehyde ferredoxin oxidoreductase n=1 Tax=Candidatus Iainarchaeum sp. TaxID=3101447 RepID=A0A497JFN6_9ARCH|nr:MAG: aldehyde ferredoxin oxidoreductase [Candidatus Diapherotrites archaeon]